MSRRGDAATQINRAAWRDGDHVADYATTAIEPVERDILDRHREALSGRVLELGCGAGRLTGHLIPIAREVHAIDISPAMVDHARRAHPGATYHRADMLDLSRFETGSFDAAVGAWSVLDAVDHAARLTVLAELHRLLRPGGLFVFSSHNRAFIPRLRRPTWILSRWPRQAVTKVVRLPIRLRNHRRMQRFERTETEYALVNDDAHDYALLHYYIEPNAQVRQLAGAGFETLECLDKAARALAPGESAPSHSRIHYVARRSASVVSTAS